MIGNWYPFGKLIFPKVNKFLCDKNDTFEKYLLWCVNSVNYKKIISECVKHSQETLKSFNIWNSKIVQFYLIEYNLNNEYKKYFQFELPKNPLGIYLEDYFENKGTIFGTYDRNYTIKSF